MKSDVTPLLLFAFASAATPGPAVLLVAASGQAFGFRKTIPAVAGSAIGFAFILIVSGLGLDQLFKWYPALNEILRWVGAGYLLYLAWRLVMSKRVQSDGQIDRPVTFLEAALFQWVNVKSLSVAAGVMAAFMTPGADTFEQAVLIAAIFSLATVPCLLAYSLFGVAIRQFLKSERWRRRINAFMAVLIVLSVGLLFI